MNRATPENARTRTSSARQQGPNRVKVPMQRALPLLMASLLCGAAARAVPATSLYLLTPLDPVLKTPKLTSVGNRLLWMVGDQTLSLDVLQAGPVSMTLASPALDPGDYRTPGEYGDERYGADTTLSETSYTLTGPDGQQVAGLTLTPGPVGQRVLFTGPLPAGHYTLSVQTTGPAKNTFAVATSGAVRLSADEVNLTLRGQDWTDVLSVTPGASPVQLRLYDTDGPSELELQVIAPDGQVRPVTGGAPLRWITLDLPEGPQAYRLQARQPRTAQQFTNTLGVALAQNGKTVPILLQDAPVVSVQGVPVPDPEAPAPTIPVPTVAAPTPPVPVPAVTVPAVPAAIVPAPAVPEPVAPVPTVTVPELAAVQSVPAPLPVAERESLLHLPFEVPVEASSVVLAETLPTGAVYLPGSSRLNGQKVADPLVGPSGRLYWPVNPASTGVLDFRVRQDGVLPCLTIPALHVDYPRDRQETLQGTFDLADYTAASPFVAPAAEENSGVLKLPLDGSVVRDRDRISVVVEGPSGQSLVPTINGEPLPDAAIGQREVNAATSTERVTYFGIRLRSGVNTLVLGGDRAQVTLAGQIARVDVQAVQSLADGSTPLRFRVRAVDAAGVATATPTLTVRSSIESSVPDADPGEGGYQLQLTDGEGVLVLPPQNTPSTLTLDFLVGDHVQRQSVPILPAPGTVGIGAASATLGFSGGTSEFHWNAKGYFEGTLGRGKLYAVTNSAGLPAQPNFNVRSPLYGDASSETVPLQGQDPVAFRYDHPDFTAQYRLSATPIDVLPFGETLTALSVTTKSQVRVGGFAALISGDQVTGERITPNGTRLLRLAHNDLVPDSETLTLLTLDRVSGQELHRRTLVRNVDYVLDQGTGVVTLSSALTLTDDDLNPLLVQAAYRLGDGGNNRTLAYGAQATYATPEGSVGVAAVNLGGVLTVGARAALNTGLLSASALAMTSGGGVQFSGTVSGKGASTAFSVRGAYQDAAYTGLAPIPVGLSASGLIRQQLLPSLNASLTGDYTSSASSSQGNVAARADYRLDAFSVGGGVRYSFGAQSGVSGLLGAGYHAGPLDVDLTHSQPVGGNVDPETVFTAKYAITPQVRLKFSDDVNWNTGQSASFGIDTTLGGTNLSASYDLPNAAGSGNRARFGVDTSLPLGKAFSVGLRGAYTRDMNTGRNDFSAGSDLRYSSAALSATVGGDLALTGGQWRTVLHGGVTGPLSSTFSVTADALTELSATPGSKLSLGYAWRDSAWNSLGNVRYQNGSLAGNQPKVTAEIEAEYHQPTWAARGELDARLLLNDSLGLTYQPSVSGIYHLTDRFGLGGSMQALLQPGSSSALGLGLEASYRALPGTWLTLGYNVLGFDGIGTRFTKPGLYLRLDLMLDEQGER